MQTVICHVDPAQRDPASPMPQKVNLAKLPNKEKSYKIQLEFQADQQRKHLELAHQGECTHAVCIVRQARTSLINLAPTI